MMRSLLTLLIMICMISEGLAQKQMSSSIFTNIKRSKIQMPEYYDRYINLTDDAPLSIVFENSLKQLDKLDLKKLEALGEQVYAPGKWTAKDILQHVIDAERILAYRVLRFARKDSTAAPGFDQDQMALNTTTKHRTYSDLVDELRQVRQSTLAMFKSFDDTTLKRKGMNWKYEISVHAMGFNIVGHQMHHLKVIEERYFPLLTRN